MSVIHLKFLASLCGGMINLLYILHICFIQFFKERWTIESLRTPGVGGSADHPGRGFLILCLFLINTGTFLDTNELEKAHAAIYFCIACNSTK